MFDEAVNFVSAPFCRTVIRHCWFYNRRKRPVIAIEFVDGYLDVLLRLVFRNGGDGRHDAADAAYRDEDDSAGIRWQPPEKYLVCRHQLTIPSTTSASSG